MGMDFARTPVHPEIRQSTTYLFANNRANNGAEKLQAQLLSVEMELLPEQLGNFDRDHNAAEEENHGICDGRNDNTSAFHEEKRLNKFRQLQRSWVNALKVEVLLLKIGATVLNAFAKVASFRSEERIQNKLDPIDL